MYKISKLSCIKFALLSKDRNLVHLDQKFASKFFFKKPIVHGINVVLLAIKKYSNLQDRKYFINEITINFKNFIHIDEKFNIKIYKNKILVISNLNLKIEIIIKKKFLKDTLKKNIYNSKLKEHLINISKIIGTIKIGNGALIHKIECKLNNNFFLKKKIFVKKILNKIYLLIYNNKYYESNVVTSKAIPYVNNKNTIKLTNKTKKKIFKKKILIFGPTGDIAKQIIKAFSIAKSSLFFYSYKINENSPIFSINKRIFIKHLIKIKPDYIFYLSSPKIYHDNDIDNKILRKLYKIVYCDFLTFLLNVILKFNISCKIFYPSSIALNNPNKYKYLNSYIYSKQEAENICKKNKYKKIVKYFRLPQFHSRSNYNILGYYEGLSLSKMSKYLKIFFNT